MDVLRRRLARALLPALLLAAACRGGARDGDAARRYTVRGEVVQLPASGRGPAQLTLRHEAIPGFVDRAGAAVGMPAMAMALDLAPGASAAGLAVGDKVEVVLAVDWARPRVELEQVRKLPAETVLQLAPAR
jgi:Cu/Ag efflux protein CusF